MINNKQTTSIEKTEQLVKALALDFLRNNRRLFNTGIMEMLCDQQKIHQSTTEKQITQKVLLIDKAFYLLKHQPIPQQQQHPLQLKNLHNMLSVLIFNISALNEHYIQQIQSHMMQSTASMSYDKNTLSMTIQKDKLATNILKQKVQLYFKIFIVNSKYLNELIFQQIPKRKQKLLKDGEMSLLQTIDYLCVKYSITNTISKQLIQILQHYQSHPNDDINNSQLHNSQCLKYINQLIFDQGKLQKDLFCLLETSSNINYRYLVTVINCNYIQKRNHKRKVFKIAIKDGKEVVQGLIVKVVKRVGKGELFSEKSQDYGPFRVILTHCLTKHFPVYWQFSSIINNELTCINQTNLNLNIFKRIQHFFRVDITIGHPLFQQLLEFMYKLLTNKYNQHTALQLMKKFLLNRFLLNPTFYILFHDPTQEEIHNFISLANTIRSLFYPIKAQQLASTLNNPNIITLSTNILQSLEYCLKKQKDIKLLSTFVSSNNNNLLYINDKIIKSIMVELYNQMMDFNRFVTKKSHMDNVSCNNDYSLEFQFVRNQIFSSKNILSKPLIQGVSEVKMEGNTNRSNNPKDNQSIRYMYDQLKEEKTDREEVHSSFKMEQKKVTTKHPNTQYQQIQTNHLNHYLSPTTKHPNNSQTRLYQQQSHLILTDRQIIQQLVQLRKQYGQRKKQIAAEYEIRRTKSIRRMSVLQSFSSRFNEFKSEIEKENDSIYVYMTTIA